MLSRSSSALEWQRQLRKHASTSGFALAGKDRAGNPASRAGDGGDDVVSSSSSMPSAYAWCGSRPRSPANARALTYVPRSSAICPLAQKPARSNPDQWSRSATAHHYILVLRPGDVLGIAGVDKKTANPRASREARKSYQRRWSISSTTVSTPDPVNQSTSRSVLVVKCPPSCDCGLHPPLRQPCVGWPQLIDGGRLAVSVRFEVVHLGHQLIRHRW